MTAEISLENISVQGVDTFARAATLRQWFTKRQSLQGTRIPILNDVTFKAKPGDRIAIIGMNGSGKSSLLKVISGNYPIHAGKRYVKGNVVPLIEMGAGFDKEATGRQNIKLSYAYRGKLKDYHPDIEARIIEFAELGEKIDLPLKTYSSGMLSRLAFASAIFQHPDILLLDEIFAAGDVGFIEKSMRALKDTVDRASITVMVNHGHNEIMELCNRFILMNDGWIVNEGSSLEINRQYHLDILKIPFDETAYFHAPIHQRVQGAF